MEQIQLTVPYAFVTSQLRPTWREVRFGVAERLFSPDGAIELARDLVGISDDAQVLELASRSHGETTADAIDALADHERTEGVDTHRVWAFLVLAWIYEQRDGHSDILDLAERVYADLDYPEQVAPLIRYTPMVEPNLGSKELNEARLIDRWRVYLDDERAYFSQRTNHDRRTDEGSESS